MNKINWNFNNTYFDLSSSFKENINPVPVKNPELVLLNDELALSLNLDFSKISHKELSKIFALFQSSRFLYDLIEYLLKSKFTNL